MKRLLACGIVILSSGGAVLLGCGGSTNDPPSSPDASTGGTHDSPVAGTDAGSGSGTGCVMTFTGGFTATADCVAHASYQSSTMLATLNINQTNSPNASGADAARFKEASASLTRSGASDFMAGTVDGSSGAQDFADLKTTDNVTYMNFGTTGGTFTITDTGPSMNQGNLTIYATPHGTYLGTITASGKADVQFSITF